MSTQSESMLRQTSFPYADAPEKDKYSVCVHCGFCLEVCPTYQEQSNESHSPRGRVYLIKLASEGLIPLDEGVISPVETCLDCRACESVCPSGVQVGALIEEARGQVFLARSEQKRASGMQALFLRSVFPHPARLHTLGSLMRFYQRSGIQRLTRGVGLLRVLPVAMREMEGVLPEVSARRALTNLPERIPVKNPKRSVGLFTGCVMDVLFTPINEATARVLTKNEIEVRVPKQQLCCGALHVHAGDREQARELAKTNIEVFLDAGVERVVINAAGCGAALKEYPELFKDDPVWHEKAVEFSLRVRDISELLVEEDFVKPQGHVERRITYHDACHLCHAQGIRAEPRLILQSIPGVTLIPLPDSERCCGSAGIYNLTQPEMAEKLLERKMDDLPKEIDAVVMGNPGCMLQIRLGVNRRQRDLDVLHTVELLDASYQKEDVAHGN
ncbi:(Fe-S)-binding protein [Ferroacidibacillus organovorans]|nr:heterodisulfide reductase-related iron-sulfur binding cluster [Ferroacidibacillus organovorans]KYP80348.1 glycolate oxidase [Ferroacidibacillus organovorans]OAG93344.1 glycolate oxidase [Ferroacidibacillus organovorans]